MPHAVSFGSKFMVFLANPKSAILISESSVSVDWSNEEKGRRGREKMKERREEGVRVGIEEEERG